MKYQKMTESPFVFLRGTCHLFYDQLPDHILFKKAPAVWVCGDLHLENFGSYKGDNRLVYFDMNDFDEATLAPCTWDLIRLLTSVFCAMGTIGISRIEAIALCECAINAYAKSLEKGKSLWVERETAEGLVKVLLDGLGERSRAEFLDKRTNLKNGKRQLRIDGRKALPADDAQKEKVLAFMGEFTKQLENPGFFQILDVARRIAGTGSLGVERYSILVEGKGSPNGNYILDLKEAKPSSLAKHLKINLPKKWKSEADRVVTIQRRTQAVSMAFLHAVKIGRKSFVLRGLQPSEDRVSLTLEQKNIRRLETVLSTMGQIVAWGHLRSSGRSGSAIADELIEFGAHSKWRKKIINIAEACAAQVNDDWIVYCNAFKEDFFKSRR